jgi:hypothetical protein
MAEDPQPGPVSLQRRPAIGERLAMGFLAVVRMVLVLMAALCLVAMLFVVAVVCTGVAPDDNWFIFLVTLLAVTGVLIVMVGGARWIETTIRSRNEGTCGRGDDPTESAGKEVVLQLDLLLILFGFALAIWIPAQISGIGNGGVEWLAFWLVVGRLAWWARREVTKRLERRAVSPDTDPCSTPEIPPSGEP